MIQALVGNELSSPADDLCLKEIIVFRGMGSGSL
jgi:hypothetical protein